MEFGEEEIRQLVESIWEQMLHLPVEALPVTPAAAGTRTLSACVSITGAWRGAVAISCSAALATQAARIMFDQASTDDVTPADQQDALGELVNMLGGNIKALLPEPCQLSLPAVAHGTDYTVRVPKTHLLHCLPMCCGGEAMAVSLLRHEMLAAA